MISRQSDYFAAAICSIYQDADMYFDGLCPRGSFHTDVLMPLLGRMGVVWAQLVSHPPYLFAYFTGSLLGGAGVL